MNQEIRVNESGFKIKECPECKRDININSFAKDGDICVLCYEDINIVKVYEVTRGDYNNIWYKNIVKGTGKQMDKYVKSHFRSTKGLEDLGSDSIGYCRYYRNGDIKMYVEAIELEIGDIDYNIDVDLTNDNNQVSSEQ